MREGKWKMHMGGRNGKAIELYDLSVDPSESQNIADQHPDVVADLKAKLDAWTSELPDSYEKATKKKGSD